MLVSSPIEYIPGMVHSPCKNDNQRDDFNFVSGNKWQREMLETVYSFRKAWNRNLNELIEQILTRLLLKKTRKSQKTHLDHYTRKKQIYWYNKLVWRINYFGWARSSESSVNGTGLKLSMSIPLFMSRWDVLGNFDCDDMGCRV